MNMNIYLEDTLASQLRHYAELSGKSKNSVIREAIKDWLNRHSAKGWPDSILNFKGYPDMPPFESLRNDLSPPKDDPLK